MQCATGHQAIPSLQTRMQCATGHQANPLATDTHAVRYWPPGNPLATDTHAVRYWPPGNPLATDTHFLHSPLRIIFAVTCHSGITQYDIICSVLCARWERSANQKRENWFSWSWQKVFKLGCLRTNCLLLREILHNVVTKDQAATPKATARRTATNYRLGTHIPALITCHHSVSLSDIPHAKQKTLIPFRRKLT